MYNNKSEKVYANNPKKSNKKSEINGSKDAEIKIRISKKDKELLQDKAKALNTSLSSYILTSCMTDASELLVQIPDTIDTLNMLNDISHAVKDTHDKQLIGTVNTILSAYIQKATSR